MMENKCTIFQQWTRETWSAPLLGKLACKLRAISRVALERLLELWINDRLIVVRLWVWWGGPRGKPRSIERRLKVIYGSLAVVAASVPVNNMYQTIQSVLSVMYLFLCCFATARFVRVDLFDVGRDNYTHSHAHICYGARMFYSACIVRTTVTRRAVVVAGNHQVHIIS